MVNLILQIAALLLGILDRHLEKQAEDEEIIENEKFKKALTGGDFDYAAYLLSRRLRKHQGHRAKGQRTDTLPSDKP